MVKKTGQILKFKEVVVQIKDTVKDSNHNITVARQRVSNVLDVDDKKVDAKDNDELKFDILKEPTNVYETKDHIILIASYVKKMSFDANDGTKNKPQVRIDTMSDIVISEKRTQKIV